MENTTDFFTNPDRAVYQGDSPQVEIADTLIPITKPRTIHATDDIMMDFGSATTFSHIYISHENIAEIQVSTQNDLQGAGKTWVETFKIGKSQQLLKIDEDNLHKAKGKQYLHFKFTADSGKTPMLKSLIAMDRLVSFADGAFSQIDFSPEHRTRGKHRMLSGRLRPFQGLGIMKRKMSFGCEHVPYLYVPKHRGSAETDYLDLGESAPTDKRYYNPGGHDEIFRKGDITKLNNLFKNHLTFIFADSLDDFPDRIFPACFEEDALGESFSDQWKYAGYSVSFTVAEL